jgi:5-methylthioadenosine/S-adenosylhomocysteine deaminase
VSTIVIRNADWAIAWDETAGRHAYRRHVDIAFAEDRITFVGRNYAGPADRVIDGKHRLVLPGLIDINSHPEHEPLYRGVREEHGVRNMHMTGSTSARRRSQRRRTRRVRRAPNSLIASCC